MKITTLQTFATHIWLLPSNLALAITLVFINETWQYSWCLLQNSKGKRKKTGKKVETNDGKRNDDCVRRMNEHIFFVLAYRSAGLFLHMQYASNKSICTNFADVHEKCKPHNREYGRVLLAKKDIFYENRPDTTVPPPHLEPFSDNRKVEIAIELPTPSFRCRRGRGWGHRQSQRESKRDIKRFMVWIYQFTYPAISTCDFHTHTHAERRHRQSRRVDMLSLSLSLSGCPVSRFLTFYIRTNGNVL